MHVGGSACLINFLPAEQPLIIVERLSRPNCVVEKGEEEKKQFFFLIENGFSWKTSPPSTSGCSSSPSSF